MNPKLNRRSLLKGLGLGVGATALGAPSAMTRLAQAAPGGPDLYYVFCYFSGGWDTLLGLDPRDPAMFNAENMRETRIQPAYELLVGSDGQLVRRGDMVFGPYIGDLANHTDKLAVIRGMSKETLSHEAGRRALLSASPRAVSWLVALWWHLILRPSWVGMLPFRTSRFALKPTTWTSPITRRALRPMAFRTCCARCARRNLPCQAVRMRRAISCSKP